MECPEGCGVGFCMAHYIAHMEGVHGRKMHITMEPRSTVASSDPLREAVADLFCCECGHKFSQVDEWGECKTHPHIRALIQPTATG